MGYTHYHNRKVEGRNYPRPQWNKVIRDFKRLLAWSKLQPINFRTGWDLDRLTLNSETIFFDGPIEDSCETFYVKRAIEPGGMSFEFTKTNLRGYDIPVCCILIILDHYLGKRIVINSDGSGGKDYHEEENWGLARKIVQKQLGYGSDFKFATEEN